MSFRRAYVLITALLTFLALPVHSADEDFDSLVSAEWLHENLDAPNVVVLDASVTITVHDDGSYSIDNGRAAYEEGHIPGAGFADLMGALADPEAGIGYAVPAPEVFAAAMEDLGVSDDSRVILYDSYGGVWAARVWWMLRWIGFDNASLLDGGLPAWKEAGYEISATPANPVAGSLSVNLRPELIVERDEVRAAIDDENVNIIDALPEAQFTGEIQMYARPGHIPTATNVPSVALNDETGRFKSHEALDALFTSDRDKRTITYCGGGIAASADAFIMTRLGYKDVAVYTASLQEWAVDPENPMVTGGE